MPIRSKLRRKNQQTRQTQVRELLAHVAQIATSPLRRKKKGVQPSKARWMHKHGILKDPGYDGVVKYFVVVRMLSKLFESQRLDFMSALT